MIAVTFLTATHQIRGNPSVPPVHLIQQQLLDPPPPRNSVHARGRMCVPYITTLYIVIPSAHPPSWLVVIQSRNPYHYSTGQQGILRALNGPYGQEELMTINDKTPNPLLLVPYNL